MVWAAAAAAGLPPGTSSKCACRQGCADRRMDSPQAVSIRKQVQIGDRIVTRSPDQDGTRPLDETVWVPWGRIPVETLLARFRTDGFNHASGSCSFQSIDCTRNRCTGRLCRPIHPPTGCSIRTKVSLCGGHSIRSYRRSCRLVAGGGPSGRTNGHTSDHACAVGGRVSRRPVSTTSC